MHKLTAQELRNLKYGEKIYRFDPIKEYSFRGFQFVGLMPSCKNYLILSDGETLAHLHISDKDDLFRGDWYSGEYDSKFVGQLLFNYYHQRIEGVREIYFKD